MFNFFRRLRIKIKLQEGAILPAYKRNGDANLDCYADENVTIPAGKRVLVSLGFSLAIPFGYEGVIKPRSGNTKDGIDIGIGTIDSNYRGICKACVINDSDKSFEIEKGDRICQIEITKVPVIEWVEVDTLDDTERGEKGFGSSGRK